jgi:hypothetical protein
LYRTLLSFRELAPESRARLSTDSAAACGIAAARDAHRCGGAAAVARDAASRRKRAHEAGAGARAVARRGAQSESSPRRHFAPLVSSAFAALWTARRSPYGAGTVLRAAARLQRSTQAAQTDGVRSALRRTPSAPQKHAGQQGRFGSARARSPGVQPSGPGVCTRVFQRCTGRSRRPHCNRRAS